MSSLHPNAAATLHGGNHVPGPSTHSPLPENHFNGQGRILDGSTVPVNTPGSIPIAQKKTHLTKKNGPINESDLEYLQTIHDEAAALFPVGREFRCAADLRQELRVFTHKKKFSKASDGCRLACSRCAESKGHIHNRIGSGEASEP